MTKLVHYLNARFAERSTWAAIGAAVAGSAALPMPYSCIMIGVGIIGTLVPSPSPNSGAN